MIYATTYSILHQPLDQWFPKWAVGGGGETEMGDWGRWSRNGQVGGNRKPSY